MKTRNKTTFIIVILIAIVTGAGFAYWTSTKPESFTEVQLDQKPEDISKEELESRTTLYREYRLAKQLKAVWNGIDTDDLERRIEKEKNSLTKLINLDRRIYRLKVYYDKRIAIAKGLHPKENVDIDTLVLNQLESDCIASTYRDCDEERQHIEIFIKSGEWKEVPSGSNAFDAYYLRNGMLLR
jgi:hypothetical protein